MTYQTFWATEIDHWLKKNFSMRGFNHEVDWSCPWVSEYGQLNLNIDSGCLKSYPIMRLNALIL